MASEAENFASSACDDFNAAARLSADPAQRKMAYGLANLAAAIVHISRENAVLQSQLRQTRS